MIVQHSFVRTSKKKELSAQICINATQVQVRQATPPNHQSEENGLLQPRFTEEEEAPLNTQHIKS